MQCESEEGRKGVLGHNQVPHERIFRIGCCPPTTPVLSGCGFKDWFGMEHCDAQEHLGGFAGAAAAFVPSGAGCEH